MRYRSLPQLLAATTLGLSLMASSSLARPSLPHQWEAAPGNYFAFDGVFYGFANDTGQGIELWVPPSDNTIRGVILHGNPGGGFGGDTRGKTRQRDLLEFAARHDFAVAGVAGFPGRRTYGELAEVVLYAMTEWGKLGYHPEISHLPFISTGGSNAGVFSFGMMCYAPERTIAITPNCGPVYVGEVTDAVLEVPAWIHVGAIDPLIPRGMENTEELFAEHLPEGGFWAWDAEIKGHENGSTDHVDLAYWEAISALRLPRETTPGEPVALRKLDMSRGWWVDHRSWDHVISRVEPFGTARPYFDEEGRYGWVPDEGIARLYQSLASRQRVYQISFANPDLTRGGQTSGVFLSSGGSYVADPGDTIEINVKLGNMVWDMQTVDFYDRTEKLGTLDLTKSDTFSFQVDGTKSVYSIYGMGENRGAPRISNPLQVVVRDPVLSAKISEQLDRTSITAYHREVAAQNTPPSATTVTSAAELPNDALGALPLSDSQAAALTHNGQLSAVWDELARALAPTAIDTDKDNPGYQGAALYAQAAYGDRGLYFLFRVENPDLENPSIDPETGLPDLSARQIDFHLASTSPQQLAEASPGPKVYANAFAFSLLRTAVQVQVPITTDLDQPQPLYLNYWSPWTTARLETSADDNYAGLGAWVDRQEGADGSRTYEVHLPWSLCGHPGLPGTPPVGTALCFQLSYNTAEPTVKLSWPHGRQPWHGPATGPQAPKPTPPIFGQLVFLRQ